MNKNILIIVVVVVIIVIGLFIWRGFEAPPVPTANQITAENPPAETLPPAELNNQEQQAKIVYTDSGFLPDLLEVKIGTAVVFENKSDSSFWPSANPHPVHNSYPAAGGCIGSIFDACQKIDTGGFWSFKFDNAGQWGYHNHFRPAHKGAVSVVE